MLKQLEMISVIVPVYNVQDYVRRCLESVAAQTFTDFECIVIDDGSTDLSGKICDEFCEGDPRFRVIHQSNAGLGFARNTGLDLAAGEYVYFIDSDDTISPRTLEMAYEKIVSEPLDWVEFAYIRVTPEGERLPGFDETTRGDGTVFSGLDALEALFWHKEYANVSMAVWNKLFRRDAIGDLRFKHASIGEDLYFIIMFLTKCGRVAHISPVLYYWTNRPGSLCNGEVYHLQMCKHFSILMETYSELGEDKWPFKVVLLKRMFRLSFTNQVRLRATESYGRFVSLVRDLRGRFLRTYLSASEIPLKERLVCVVGGYFPRLVNRFARWMGFTIE